MTRAQLRLAIGALPEPVRSAVRLHYFGEAPKAALPRGPYARAKLIKEAFDLLGDVCEK